MNQKTKLIWLEVGLAIALILSLSLLGAKLGAESEKKEKKIEQAEAENEIAAEKSGGITDEKSADDKSNGAEETEANTDDGSAAETEEVIADGQYPIMGKSSVTVEQMVSYFQIGGEGARYPAEQLSKGGADSIETFCQIYYEECTAEGVRPEVAFVQTMKETGWLQFRGDTSVDQFNFAGLGTTGGGVPGNSYPDVRTGIRAQIQHLKAYATADVLARECVDERYEYVTKGCAPYVEWLGQQENPEGMGWATAENYGYTIVEMIHAMNQM